MGEKRKRPQKTQEDREIKYCTNCGKQPDNGGDRKGGKAMNRILMYSYKVDIHDYFNSVPVGRLLPISAGSAAATAAATGTAAGTATGTVVSTASTATAAAADTVATAAAAGTAAASSGAAATVAATGSSLVVKIIAAAGAALLVTE